MSSNEHLVPVVAALVNVAGVRAILFALAATCHTRSLECPADQAALAETWETVGDDIESFARTSLRGLR